jgi:hypothetical protein
MKIFGTGRLTAAVNKSGRKTSETFNSSTAWRMNKILAQIKHLNKNENTKIILINLTHSNINSLSVYYGKKTKLKWRLNSCY